MTTVAVIKSVMARINDCLDNQPKWLQEQTNQFLEGLEKTIKDILESAAGATVAEKKVVLLSYDIVQAIEEAAAASCKPNKESGSESVSGSSNKSLRRQKPAVPGLEDLLSKLTRLQGELHKKDPDEGTDQNPGKALMSRSSSGLVRKSQGDLLEKLREELMNRESSSPVVYLVGESGMGKTTVARKLFHDPRIRGHFELFAWVPVTRNFHIKRVLQLLLQKLGLGLELEPSQGPQPDIREMNQIDLVSQIFARLKGKLYLVVLEDVESMDDWESISLAFPIANQARVIITSSNMDIQPPAPGTKEQITGLSHTEIITLLKKEAALKSDLLGKVISEISGGSPLFATILGKSLQYAEEEENEQQLVGELDPYIYMSEKGSPGALEASYKRLKSEIRARLLYLGQFPAGQDVDVDKLYLMLAAEKLIISQKKPNNISPWGLSSEYLNELDRVKLVHVQEDYKVPTRGIYRSCKLHDRVRDFCKSKASDEEFLHILDLGDSSSHEKVGDGTRRLAVYLREGNSTAVQSVSNIKQLAAVLKKLLTLVIFDTFEKKTTTTAGWPSEFNDLSESGYLRVLSFDGVDFKAGKLPKGLDKLLLLRYLSFRGCRLEELSSSVSKLTQLETLDLLVQDDCTMVIPNNIFANKKRMLHLYFPRKYRSGDGGKTKLQLQAMDRLEILVNFHTDACDVEALSTLNNLKILSTISKGKVDDVVLQVSEKKMIQYSCVNIASFDCYNSDSLPKLAKLLGCKSVHSVHIEGRIGKLPKAEEEKGKLVREIVLDGSQLQLDPMNYLGNFQNLHSLVLSNDAFLGVEIIIAPAPLFSNLRSLKLQSLQFLKKLTIKSDAMPTLSALQIHSCPSFRQLYIPNKIDERLKKVQEDRGGDAYSIMPFPSIFNITLDNLDPNDVAFQPGSN